MGEITTKSCCEPFMKEHGILIPVKVFRMVSDEWEDIGTGNLVVIRAKGATNNQFTIIIEADDNGNRLIDSDVKRGKVFKREEETLITWYEKGSARLCISFAETSDCLKIWKQMCDVNDVDSESSSTTSEEVDDLLPPCTYDNLATLLNVFTNEISTYPRRFEIIDFLVESDNYIANLVRFFRTCEKDNNTTALHDLCKIIKAIFLIDVPEILDKLIDEEIIFDVIGVLEYESELPRNHRFFLNTQCSLVEPVPFTSQELRSSIKHLYRVIYINDAIFAEAGFFDNSKISSLSDVITDEKRMLVKAIQADEHFLPAMFSVLTDVHEPDSRKLQGLKFLQELFNYATKSTIQERIEFSCRLLECNFLPVIGSLIRLDSPLLDDSVMILLDDFLEYRPYDVRSYLLGVKRDPPQSVEQDNRDGFLLNVLIKNMIGTDNRGISGSYDLMCFIKSVLVPLDLEGDDARMEPFLDVFYRHSINVLCAPLTTELDNFQAQDTYISAHSKNLIIELLTHLVKTHRSRARDYIIKHNLLQNVLVFLQSKHQFFSSCVVRFMRAIISLRDVQYDFYVADKALLEPIISMYVRIRHVDKLLKSTFLNLFEDIRSGETDSLVDFIVEHKSWSDIKDTAPVFESMESQYKSRKLKSARETSISPVLAGGHLSRRAFKELMKMQSLSVRSSSIEDLEECESSKRKREASEDNSPSGKRRFCDTDDCAEDAVREEVVDMMESTPPSSGRQRLLFLDLSPLKIGDDDEADSSEVGDQQVSSVRAKDHSLTENVPFGGLVQSLNFEEVETVSTGEMTQHTISDKQVANQVISEEITFYLLSPEEVVLTSEAVVSHEQTSEEVVLTSEAVLSHEQTSEEVVRTSEAVVSHEQTSEEVVLTSKAVVSHEQTSEEVVLTSEAVVSHEQTPEEVDTSLVSEQIVYHSFTSDEVIVDQITSEVDVDNPETSKGLKIHALVSGDEADHALVSGDEADHVATSEDTVKRALVSGVESGAPKDVFNPATCDDVIVDPLTSGTNSSENSSASNSSLNNSHS